jgi:hypothetical protein
MPDPIAPGAQVQGFLVVERAPTPPSLHHYCWWLRCKACGEQRWETGSTLRRAARGRFRIWCRHCGDRPTSNQKAA